MPDRAGRRAVLIAGPTASGKSALALRRARDLGGVVVNADAMQVYDVLRVLTARPGPGEVDEVPHLLYGVVSPAQRFSTGDWLRAVAELLPKLEGRPLVLTGGTGLYFEALTNGLAPVPSVPEAAVAAAEAEVQGLDREARQRLIAARDPEMALRLNVPDPQRVVRALAVLAATGRSLVSFQEDRQPAILEGYELERLVLNPDRDVLRARIASRFEIMLENGAVDEVRQLRALELEPSLPAMKAIGVREIGDWIDGRSSREQAVERAVIATRQYAKRQRTWFRNRMPDWDWIDPEALPP
ncbi:MAG TPA: tRNA (adenosine(37)-N6)-dimethylallyltransferase MiaA [Devosiaceae bacterium]|nr:tRNA (adenosine(37)-N6)-dimethylallyltransferase MiaA [Devosiaceae bacterium]